MADVIEDLQRTYKSIKNLESARISAISHVLYIKRGKIQFVEVICNKKLYHIAISEENIRRIANEIIVGAKYDITNVALQEMICHPDGGACKVYLTTSKSEFVRIESAKVKTPRNSSDLIKYEGVVTAEICAPLRIYELDDAVELHIGYFMRRAKVRLPQVGQNVCVYNAHWEKYDTKPCLILCGRGHIKILDEREHVNLIGNQLPNSSNIICGNTHWFRKQFSTFEKKFTADFLKANNIKSYSPLELLRKCIKIHHSNNVRHTSLIKEFMSRPHCCGILDKGDEYLDYKTLEEFCDRPSNSEYHWSVDSSQSADGTVGVLTASMDSGYWVLSDATNSVTCLITGSMDKNLHGSLVILTKCSFFVESLKFGKAECYIHVAVKHIKVVKAPNVQQKTRLENERKKLKCNANCRENCEEELDLLHRPVVISKDRLWQILMLHKMATVKINKETFCCLLVSKIRETTENGDGKCNQMERRYLLLDEKLVQYVPLLHNNMMYKLVFPCTETASLCTVRLKQICNKLPDVMGYRLPENCVMCSMESTDVAFLNSIPDCYSVGKKELYEEVEHKELINIEGVICDRFHIDSHSNKEKNDPVVPGFGVSDGKTVVLKLYDPSLNSEIVVCLYLNEWFHRSYPLGLIPGTRIQALFVNMVKSQNSSNMYFKVTDLTRLHVLKMPGSVSIADEEAVSCPFVPSCILTQEASKVAPGNLLWGLIRGTKILKFTASVSCTKCNMFFKQGKCTGCTSFPSSPKLTASAKCYIADAVGQVIIFINGDLLPVFFGVRKSYWNVIAKLVGLDGKEISLPETECNNEGSPGKKLLQKLVDVSNEKMAQFYVLCRKMKTSTSDENDLDKVPVLYCVDIQVPEASSFYRSLQNS